MITKKVELFYIKLVPYIKNNFAKVRLNKQYYLI